jgi:ATP-binding cassette subfamily B protein
VSIGLVSISALLALVPAFILYEIAAVFYHHDDFASLTVTQIIFLAIAAAIVRLTLLIWGRQAAGDATMIASRDLRARLAAKIGTLPMGFLSQGRPASFATQLLDDVEDIGLFLSGAFVDLVGAAALIAGATALIAWRDWRVAAILPLLILAGWLLNRSRATLPPETIQREQRARDALAAATLQALRGTVSGKALPPVPPQSDPVRVYAAEYRAAAKPRAEHVATVDAIWRAYAGAIPAVLLLAALWLGGERLDLPALVLVVAVGLRAGGALAVMLGATRAATPALASAQRIADSFALPSAMGGDAQPPDDPTIRFAGVSFAYPASDEPVLRDVAFTAAPGKVTAIVGPSGSGKTTLLRLAAGFWKPDRGTVEVGGVDLQAIASDALAQRIGYVFQDVFLLNDTIAENLRIGNPDATDEQIQGAAQAARAHEFISALPDGYETMVGDRGLNLSRGERQRLQIARALLKDAPILLLDEPTASVDPATEWEIQQSLNALLRGKTVLAVTHRLGTIVDADQIVVLDRDGRIEASGTHAQLLENSLTYARLWSDYSGAIDWIAAEGASAP